MRIVFLIMVALILQSCKIGTSAGDDSGRSPNPDGAQVPQDMRIDREDIIAVSDKMVRSMLQNPILNNSRKAAVVIVDDKYFKNDTIQRMNKRLIVDDLRVSLLRAANGRIRFIARHASNLFENEQRLREEGKISGGTAKKQAGATFRLTGSFKHDIGRAGNYVLFTFEMVDLNTLEIVWADQQRVLKKRMKER